jgi:hypothetical protein
MPYPLIIAYKLGPISLFDHFSASPLGGDNSQLYPMHMKHNGATRTLLRLIDGVFPNSACVQCKLLRRTQSGRYSAKALPTPTALRQNHPTESAGMLIASRHGAINSGAVHGRMREQRMLHLVNNKNGHGSQVQNFSSHPRENQDCMVS